MDFYDVVHALKPQDEVMVWTGGIQFHGKVQDVTDSVLTIDMKDQFKAGVTYVMKIDVYSVTAVAVL